MKIMKMRISRVIIILFTVLFFTLTSCALYEDDIQSSMENGTEYTSEDSGSVGNTDNPSAETEDKDSDSSLDGGNDEALENDSVQKDENSSKENLSEENDNSDWWLGEIPVNN